MPTSATNIRPIRPVVAGLLVGLLTVIWSAVMVVAEWIYEPEGLRMYGVALSLQALTIATLLFLTRSGRSFSDQVKLGMVATAIGSLVVFAGVVVLFSVVFPNHFDDLRAVRLDVLLDAHGMTLEEANTLLDSVAGSQTPTALGIVGTMGTLATGFIASVLAAVVFRAPKRPPS